MGGTQTSSGITTDNRFVIIPQWVLMSPISDGALRLYAVLMKHADNMTGEAFPSRGTLAREIGKKSVRSIDGYIKELEQLGALRVERRKKSNLENWSNLYTVITVNRTGEQDSAPGGAASDALTKTPGLNPPSSFTSAAADDPVSRQPQAVDADHAPTGRQHEVSAMAQALIEQRQWEDEHSPSDAMEQLCQVVGRDAVNDMLNTNMGKWLDSISALEGGGRYGAGAALNAYERWAARQSF